MTSRSAERAVTLYRLSRSPLRCLAKSDPCGLRGDKAAKAPTSGATEPLAKPDSPALT